VRWRDLDAFAHVNNATFASYIEQARTEVWQQLFGGREALDVPFFVTRLEIDFKRSIALYDEVVVWLRVGEIRGASFDFEYLIKAGNATSATARTALACVDNRTGRPVRMTPELREKLSTLQVDSA
jgi:acyl-CoA thioester hydrolase